MALSTPARPRDSAAWRILHENGLSIVLLCMFFTMLCGETLAGWCSYNSEHQDHGKPHISLGRYLHTGHFLEATTENWESEFLEMAMFVWLTACFRQKGSPESKSFETEPQDRQPDPNRPGAPWPVRRGGLALAIYSRSLTFAFLLMFFVSFLLHAAGGANAYSERQIEHGHEAVSMFQFMGTSDFWFQSLQNWQSEFLGIAMMVILSIFLRQRGSAESKPVDAAHHEHD